MNAPSKIHRPEFNLEPGTYIPLIFSKPIYHPDQRSLIKGRLLFIKDDYDIGIPRLHAFIVSTVDQNKKRIRRPNGAIGIHVDQLSDRKSTRLNSSHDQISYAVFCLKKKRKKKKIKTHSR